MSSSERVLLRRRHVQPTGAGAAEGSNPSQRAASEPRATPGGASLLQGRARRAPGSTPAAGSGSLNEPTGQPLSALAGITGAMKAGELGAELRQMRQIADERGYAEGRARAEAELRGAIQAVETLLGRIEAVAPRESVAIAHTIAELSLAVARRVVGREIQLDPTLLCDALEEAVQTINGSPEARVLLHPATVGPVMRAWEERHGLSHLGKRWIFEADPNMAPGGCTLRYDHGFVDCGLDAQLEEIGIALDRAIPGYLRADSAQDVA